MVTGVIERSKVAGEDLKTAGSLGFSDSDGHLPCVPTPSRLPSTSSEIVDSPRLPEGKRDARATNTRATCHGIPVGETRQIEH